MATRHIASIEELTSAMTDIFGSHPEARELWVALRTGVPWYWLVTAEVDPATERELYRLAAMVFDQVSGALFDVHIINPSQYEPSEASRNAIPVDARLITAFRH